MTTVAGQGACYRLGAGCWEMSTVQPPLNGRRTLPASPPTRAAVLTWHCGCLRDGFLHPTEMCGTRYILYMEVGPVLVDSLA
jgi:hypothetical protein